MFALFYVVLAPFVGALADSMPKGRVMLMSNFVKVLGCLLMLFGTHPLMAYALVGLGAAAYSPAKYGILTELLPASQLVKANGWIEGLTIASIILGVLLGGQLVGPMFGDALEKRGVGQGTRAHPGAQEAPKVVVVAGHARFSRRLVRRTKRFLVQQARFLPESPFRGENPGGKHGIPVQDGE
jgi:MFS family permease